MGCPSGSKRSSWRHRLRLGALLRSGFGRDRPPPPPWRSDLKRSVIRTGGQLMSTTTMVEELGLVISLVGSCGNMVCGPRVLQGRRKAQKSELSQQNLRICQPLQSRTQNQYEELASEHLLTPSTLTLHPPCGAARSQAHAVQIEAWAKEMGATTVQEPLGTSTLSRPTWWGRRPDQSRATIGLSGNHAGHGMTESRYKTSRYQRTGHR